MPRKLLICLVLALGFGLLLPAQDVGTVPQAQPAYYALTGGTVSVGDGKVLENATVIVKDGLLEAVGTGLAVPAGAWALDVAGMHVYPGLIDALTNEGLQRQAGESEGRPGGGGPPRGRQAESAEGPGYFAHVAASDQLDADDSKLKAWRESGVLSLNVAPRQGIFQGRSALVNLNAASADQMVVLADTGLIMSFSGLGFRTYPGSLMGVIAHIRQTLFDAAHYRTAWAEYNKNRRGMKRPRTDRTLEVLGPALDGQLPLVFPAKSEREIERALNLCRQAEVRCLIAGGIEAPAVAERLKSLGVPVLVSLNYPKKSRDQHPEDEEPLSALRDRAAAPAAASKLHESGVSFAFYSDGASSRDFIANLRKAVEQGLPKEAALRAATLSAAEILGAADQLGSLEKGKIANLIVSDKDLFDEKAKFKHVFVDGIHFELAAVEEKKEDKEREEGAPGRRRPGKDSVNQP